MMVRTLSNKINQRDGQFKHYAKKLSCSTCRAYQSQEHNPCQELHSVPVSTSRESLPIRFLTTNAPASEGEHLEVKTRVKSVV
jgi:hypothetical protein